MEADDNILLSELMLHADQLCSKLADIGNKMTGPEQQELRTKLGQCRNQISLLQELYNDDRLHIEMGTVRALFRTLVIGLMWSVFYAHAFVDFRIFRMLVRIEAGFTYLLIQRS